MSSPRPPRAAPFVLALALFGISLSGPLVRLSHAEPVAIAVWRLALALTIVAGFLLATGSWRQWRTLSRGDLSAAIGAGVILALHFWAWISSVSMTSVAASVVLVNMHPVAVVIGSVLWLKERPTRVQVAGIAVALGGALLIATDDAMRGGSDVGASMLGSRALAGDALAFVGAITFALYVLAGRRVRRKLDLWPYVGLVYFVCLACLAAIALAKGVHVAPQPPREVAIFVAIALGPMMLGHTGFNWALGHLPAYVISLTVLAEPLGATLLAAFLPGIGEVPGSLTLLGGAVIIAGILLATRRTA